MLMNKTINVKLLVLIAVKTRGVIKGGCYGRQQ